MSRRLAIRGARRATAAKNNGVPVRAHPNHHHSMISRPNNVAMVSCVRQQPIGRAFSAERSAVGIQPANIPERPWLDRKVPFDVRVEKFMQAKLGTLEYHAVAHDAVSLVEQCCKVQDFVGLKYAHDVLDRVLAEKRHVDEQAESSRSTSTSSWAPPPFPVPTKLFDKILYGWCNLATKGKVARVRMRETLDLMLEVVKHDDQIMENRLINSDQSQEALQHWQRERFLPALNTYNTILTGLRNASKVSRDAAPEAEELLHEMIQNHTQYGWHTKPNTKSYSLVIAAYASSGLKYAGKNAERLLRTVQEVHEEEKKAYLEQYGVPYNANDISANRRRIVTADAIIYTNVVRAYSHRCSPYEAAKARDLLIEATNVKDGSVQVDFKLFTAAINAFANVAQNMKLPKETRFMAARQAEEILLVMLEQQSGFDLGLSQSGNKAENRDVHAVAPFNACINAYAKCGSPKAAYKAESMLQKLLSSYIEGESTIQPDSISFKSVLGAWSYCGGYYPDAPQKAEELLKLQFDLVEAGTLDESAMPDSQAFSIVISTYGRSDNPDKVHHAYRILQQLLTGIAEGKVLLGKNIVVAFTAVLNAVAHSKPVEDGRGPLIDSGKGDTKESGADGFNSVQRDDEYTIALQTYREMKENVYDIGCHPDHMTFSTMLHAIGAQTRQNSVERRQMIQLVFEDACAAGEVSRLVVKALRKECPDSELYASLLGSKELADSIKSVDELPRAWTRNVSQSFRVLKRDYEQVAQPKQKGNIKS